MGFIRRYGLTIRPPPQVRSQVEEHTLQGSRVTLPYISNVSEATARLLAPYDVSVAHNPNQTLRCKVMRLKDPLPVAEKSNIVYKINCENCPVNYVGETAKRVKTRVHEHKLAVRRGDQYSQIGTHMRESGHRFDFNNVQVMASDNTKGGRLLKEAWLSNGQSINRHVDLCPAHMTLRAWTMRDRSSEGRQLNATMDPQQGRLREITSLGGTWMESNHQQLRNSLSMEARTYPQWTQEHTSNQELISNGPNTSPEAERDSTEVRSCTGTRLLYNQELKDRRVTCNATGDSMACSAHDIPRLSRSCLRDVGEECEDEKVAYYNLRASTYARRHLEGTAPCRRKNVNHSHKDPASLPPRKATRPQRADGCTSGKEGIAPVREENNSQLVEAGSTEEEIKLTPVGEETGGGINGGVRGIEQRDDAGVVSSWAVETNDGGVIVQNACEQRDRGRRVGIGDTRKQSEVDKQRRHGLYTSGHMGLKSSPDLWLHGEGGKDCDISTNKEGGELIAGNTETTIRTQVDWLGPVTRSRSRAQRALH